MVFINKCSICENKGFFLKLNNGLCTNCQQELKNIENEYTKLLQDISLNPDNKESYSITLSKLYPDIVKFNKYSTILNMDSISKLINCFSLDIDNLTLYDNIKEKVSSNSLDTIPSVEDSLTLSIDIDSNNSSSSKIDETVLSTNVFQTELNNTNENIPSPDTNLYLDNLPSSTLSIDDDNTPKPSPSASDKLIIDNLYNNTSNLIDLLNNPSISLNELGKNFFKLKESFYPALKQYDVKEVNGVNVANFIDTIERKLCHLTNRTPDTLYSYFNYVTLSLQTSGINKDYNYILEISALKINYGEIIDEFYTLINPIRTIKSEVTKRTGITNEMVSSAPTLDIALINFKKFIEDYALIIYNSTNILAFLNYNFDKLFGYTLNNKDTCCLRLYRSRYTNFHGEAPKLYDIGSICNDILPRDEISKIENLDSISKSISLALYKLFEILKSKYK